MSELSVFIDESGDFGAYDPRAPFYIVGIVFQDQKYDITAQLHTLDESLRRIGFEKNCVHAGPLIRKEQEYSNMTVAERLKILRRMINFTSKIEFSHKSFIVEKKHLKDSSDIAKCLKKQIISFIEQNYSFFLSYDRIKIYYDNGQSEITKIITSVFFEKAGSNHFQKSIPERL